jgi:diguanylate cyclase (GGDEF)-like protein/PAS domain S-box-containing protein
MPESKVGRIEVQPLGSRPAKTVLLIEDQRDEACSVGEMLDQAGAWAFELVRVASVSDAESYFSDHSVDIVLLDLQSGDGKGVEAINRVRAAAPRVSIVLLCSAEDEAIAEEAIQQGAQDYLIKGQIEPRELARALLNAAERKMVKEVLFVEKERAQATLDSIGDGVICTDTWGNISFMNHVAEAMTGWQLEEVLGKPVGEFVKIVDAVTREAIRDPMAKAASQDQKGSLPLNCVLVQRNGNEVFIEDSVAPIHDREGRVTGAVIVFRDVSATRAFEKELTFSAQHDFLTGLPNRSLLEDRVRQTISFARRHRCHAAVLFLDLDGFKQVNDTLGHLIGDKVLQSVAQRLQGCVRSPDSVVRMGGDEFVVVLQELKRPRDAVNTVKRLLKGITQVHRIGQQEIVVTASIGVSTYPDDGEDAETLLRNADTAMYTAKQDENENYRLYSPGMTARVGENPLEEQKVWNRLDWYELKSRLTTK